MSATIMNRVSTLVLVASGLTALGFGGLPLYIGGGITLAIGLVRAVLE